MGVRGQRHSLFKVKLLEPRHHPQLRQFATHPCHADRAQVPQCRYLRLEGVQSVALTPTLLPTLTPAGEWGNFSRPHESHSPEVWGESPGTHEP